MHKHENTPDTDFPDDLPWEGVAINPEAIPAEDNRPTYTEKCKKCGGTGRVLIGYVHQRYVTCYACKGAGTFERKTSPEARAKAKASTAARKARTIEENLAGFTAHHPEVAAWLTESAPSFEFAASLLEGVRKFGGLTPNQLAAAERAIAKRNEARAARAAREAAAPVVDIDRIARAFDAAQASGIKRPKLSLGDFRFSLAPSTGVNAGALYVKMGDVYLGKIAGGKFSRSRDCTDAQQNDIVAACSDPFAAAVAHGKRTGSCSCCGRELTNPESIALGIGPICRANWGL
jgi:Family of unknown function (DUF6011)